MDLEKDTSDLELSLLIAEISLQNEVFSSLQITSDQFDQVHIKIYQRSEHWLKTYGSLQERYDICVVNKRNQAIPSREQPFYFMSKLVAGPLRTLMSKWGLKLSRYTQPQSKVFNVSTCYPELSSESKGLVNETENFLVRIVGFLNRTTASDFSIELLKKYYLVYTLYFDSRAELIKYLQVGREWFQDKLSHMTMENTSNKSTEDSPKEMTIMQSSDPEMNQILNDKTDMGEEENEKNNSSLEQPMIYTDFHDNDQTVELPELSEDGVCDLSHHTPQKSFNHSHGMVATSEEKRILPIQPSHRSQNIQTDSVWIASEEVGPVITCPEDIPLPQRNLYHVDNIRTHYKQASDSDWKLQCTVKSLKAELDAKNEEISELKHEMDVRYASELPSCPQGCKHSDQSWIKNLTQSNNDLRVLSSMYLSETEYYREQVGKTIESIESLRKVGRKSTEIAKNVSEELILTRDLLEETSDRLNEANNKLNEANNKLKEANGKLKEANDKLALNAYSRRKQSGAYQPPSPPPIQSMGNPFYTQQSPFKVVTNTNNYNRNNNSQSLQASNNLINSNFNNNNNNNNNNNFNTTPTNNLPSNNVNRVNINQTKKKRMTGPITYQVID